MYYEINVAVKDAKPGWNGKPTYSHFFATTPRSITDENKLRQVIVILKEKFPEPEFQITAWNSRDYREKVDIDQYLAKEVLEREELKKDYYLFGNKGAVWSDKIHIAKTGVSNTLCGTPMLSSNYANNGHQAGCPECLSIYKKQIDGSNS